LPPLIRGVGGIGLPQTTGGFHGGFRASVDSLRQGLINFIKGLLLRKKESFYYGERVELDLMLARRIIPCLDVTDGRVVKGVNFLNLQDAGDPVEIAIAYDEQTADELVFLDITASSDARNIMRDVVERTAKNVFMPFTVGGGLRNLQDMHDMLNAGADKVSINTSALEDPDLISQGAARFGSQCIVVAIDAKKREDQPGWEVYTHGGRYPARRDAVRHTR